MMVIFGFLGALMLVVMIGCDTPMSKVSRNDTESTNSVVSENNGTKAESKYPFLAAIGFKGKYGSRSVNYTKTVCSGSIIDHYRVVTTCSCFQYPNHPRRRARPYEYVVSAGISPELGEADSWNVDDIKYHPDCDQNSDYKTYVGNVAVVWVEQPGFTFDSRIQPMKNYPGFLKEAAWKEFVKMSSSAMKCAAVGWSHKSPMMQKLHASLIPYEQCVNPTCNQALSCLHSDPDNSFMVRMNGLRVNLTALATGTPLICNNTVWAIVDTVKSCTNNIFTVSSPDELLYAIHNFTVDSSVTMFSQIAHNSVDLSKRISPVLFAVLISVHVLRMVT